jgi:hypothetical protein
MPAPKTVRRTSTPLAEPLPSPVRSPRERPLVSSRGGTIRSSRVSVFRGNRGAPRRTPRGAHRERATDATEGASRVSDRRPLPRPARDRSMSPVSLRARRSNSAALAANGPETKKNAPHRKTRGRRRDRKHRRRVSARVRQPPSRRQGQAQDLVRDRFKARGRVVQGRSVREERASCPSRCWRRFCPCAARASSAS